MQNLSKFNFQVDVIGSLRYSFFRGKRDWKGLQIIDVNAKTQS